MCYERLKMRVQSWTREEASKLVKNAFVRPKRSFVKMLQKFWNWKSCKNFEKEKCFKRPETMHFRKIGRIKTYSTFQNVSPFRKEIRLSKSSKGPKTWNHFRKFWRFKMSLECQYVILYQKLLKIWNVKGVPMCCQCGILILEDCWHLKYSKVVHTPF